VSGTRTIDDGRLQIRWRRGDGEHEVWLEGVIDEQAHLGHVLDVAAKAPRLILDTAGVRFINSVGVREWIRMMRRLDERGVAVVLRALSEVMVHQLNMIVEAKGSAAVASFQAPYACENCALEQAMTVDTHDHPRLLQRLEPPPMTCPDCGHAMEFVEIPERYFLFLE
jgi:anti-anti-sigma regulatory factor